MSTRESTDPMAIEPLICGIALAIAGVVAAGAFALDLRVRLGSYEVLSVIAGVLAIGLGTWGLYAATKGRYRTGVGSLSGAAGFTLVFLAPLAKSPLLFAVVGGLFLALSGLFLIATGYGYAVVVDDTAEATTEADDG
ncbi:hypothetical protein [Halorhabdus sp. BNX81]|uniref:hypothetical protein n=1 Tax=Halorhabdus sp. BNX81 TaxID=2980181 RepID=UPI0023DD34C4|nr:hypothetical protein [Halorhabdus sp. BNX81]